MWTPIIERRGVGVLKHRSLEEPSLSPPRGHREFFDEFYNRLSSIRRLKIRKIIVLDCLQIEKKLGSNLSNLLEILGKAFERLESKRKRRWNRVYGIFFYPVHRSLISYHDYLQLDWINRSSEFSSSFVRMDRIFVSGRRVRQVRTNRLQ